MGLESLRFQLAALAGLSGGLAWWGGLHGFRLSWFLRSGSHLLVHGIQLILHQASDVESNSWPERGSCVGCGLTPGPNARALLRCREGCGRDSHYREACSGL
jgi:hypothetical protein